MEADGRVMVRETIDNDNNPQIMFWLIAWMEGDIYNKP